jgi:hypothetical protein
MEERGRRFSTATSCGELGVLPVPSAWPACARMLSLALVAGALCVAPAIAFEGSASAGWGVRLEDHRVAGRSDFKPWTQVLVPALGFVIAPLGTRIEGRAGGRLEVGEPVPGEGMGPLRRGTAAEARADLSRAFAGGGAVNAQGFATRSHDLLDDDHATVSAAGDELRWGASASGSLRRFEGEARLRGWRSDAPRSESRSLAWGARAILLRTPSASLFAGGHERRLESDESAVLTARVASLGLRRSVAPWMEATLALGAVDERLVLTREPLRPAASLELASPGDPGEKSDFRLRLAHELGDEFDLEIGRMVRGARLWAQASSTVDIEGASAHAPAVIGRAAFGAQDTLGGATAVGVRASFARERSYRGLPDDRTATTRIGAWVARRIQPWLTCRAGWELLSRTGLGLDAPPETRRSRLELLLQAGKP